jgi:hypothetical protein
VVPHAIEVTATSGSVTLDLTSAVISSPVLRIAATIKSGSLTIITRPGIEVDTDEVEVRSGTMKVRRPSADGPALLRVEVTGSVRSGSIVARPPRRRFLDWLLRRPLRY